MIPSHWYRIEKETKGVIIRQDFQVLHFLKKWFKKQNTNEKAQSFRVKAFPNVHLILDYSPSILDQKIRNQNQALT